MRAVLLAVLLLLTPTAAHARDDWDKAGSLSRDVLVVTALALPAVKGDWNGDLQALASLGAAFVVTQGLKRTVRARRPDGRDEKSFPSGHSSMSFAAAATLHDRYGWKVGLPAQALAAFVGVSRVHAKRHRWGDVIAGAAIGEASGFLLTKRLDRNVGVTPWGDTRSAGVALSMRF